MQLSQILLGPIITEKAVRLQEANQHLFTVHKDATKIDVMQAIRTFYGVTPLAVRIIRVPSKVRMISRSKIMTKRRATKKAIIALPKGASLELVSVKKEAPVAKEKKKTSSSSKK